MSEQAAAPLWEGESYPFAISFYPGLAYALEKAGYSSTTAKAIILSRIHDQVPTGIVKRDGLTWVCHSHEFWRAEHFPFMSVDSIKKLLTALVEDGLLLRLPAVSRQPVPYRPNYAKLAELAKNEPDPVQPNVQVKLKQSGTVNGPADTPAPADDHTALPADDSQSYIGLRPDDNGVLEFHMEVLELLPTGAKNLQFMGLSQGKDWLYWGQGGKALARCTVEDYLFLTGRLKNVHPNNLPTVTAQCEGREVWLRTGTLGSASRKPLEELYAAHHGYVGAPGSWKRGSR